MFDPCVKIDREIKELETFLLKEKDIDVRQKLRHNLQFLYSKKLAVEKMKQRGVKF